MSDSAKILLVDDEPDNLQVLGQLLKNEGYNLSFAQSGQDALSSFSYSVPHLILLDIMMPGMNGFDTARKIRENEAYRNIPIIFITALDEIDSKIKAFTHGGKDYIIKPFDRLEVLHRVNTHIRLYKYQTGLEALVSERVREIENVNSALVSALEHANKYNDEVTGNHILRVGEYSRMIAEELKLERYMVMKIRRFASLHDVGKVGVADAILKKPGPLSETERIEMEKHTEIGFNILNLPGISRVALNIVRFHHERWDGKGYPAGLSGMDIPIEARIVALADVYDALRSRRPYKEAYSHERSRKIILGASGTQFDPEVIGAFERVHFLMESYFDKH